MGAGDITEDIGDDITEAIAPARRRGDAGRMRVILTLDGEWQAELDSPRADLAAVWDGLTRAMRDGRPVWHRRADGGRVLISWQSVRTASVASAPPLT